VPFDELAGSGQRQGTVRALVWAVRELRAGQTVCFAISGFAGLRGTCKDSEWRVAGGRARHRLDAVTAQPELGGERREGPERERGGGETERGHKRRRERRDECEWCQGGGYYAVEQHLSNPLS